MKRLVLGLIVAAAAFGQAPKATAPAKAPAKAAAKPAASNGPAQIDKVAIEKYVRHLAPYPANITVEVSDPKPASIAGMRKIAVRASLGLASETKEYLISDDGKTLLQGTLFDLGKHPFHEAIEALKTNDAPMKGTIGAPVKIVVFADFQCSYCREEALTMRDNLLKTFPTEVQVFYKDFPLEQIHPWAKSSAVIGRCLYDESPAAFWDYHDWIYEKQASITAENLREEVAAYLKSKGKNPDTVNACVAAGPATKAVEQSMEEAVELNINSTPTLFINGRRLAGAVKWEGLKQIIDIEVGYQKTLPKSADCCSVGLSK
jgi:protein-disulfide isomerase